MGGPSPLRPEERERLIRLSIPEYTRETMAATDGVLSLKIYLAPQDVCVICKKRGRIIVILIFCVFYHGILHGSTGRFGNKMGKSARNPEKEKKVSS